MEGEVGTVYIENWGDMSSRRGFYGGGDNDNGSNGSLSYVVGGRV